jgi:Methyltransferase FkbM domain
MFLVEKIKGLRILIKMDTEGYVYKVLQGAAYTLKKCQAVVICHPV